MAGKRIGLRDIAALEPNTTQWCPSLPGFGIRRQRSEVVSFVLLYRHEGRQRFHTLGRAGVLTPDQARDEARKLLGEVARGHDPAGDKHARRNAMTVGEVCDAYLEAAEKGLLIGKRGRVKKPSTLQKDRLRVSSWIKPLLGHLPIASVGPQDIRAFRDAVAEGKPVKNRKTATGRPSRATGGRGGSTRILGMLGNLWQFAIRQGWAESNPVHGVERWADRKREIRLSDAQYQSLSAGIRKAAEGPRPLPPPALAATRLLALTGARRGEITGLRWEDVDLDRRIIVLSDSKTGRSVRPLAQAAVELIRQQPRIDGQALIFPSIRTGGVQQGFTVTFRRLAKRSSLPDEITPHILRHTYASVAADLGYSDATIAALIGHRGGGMTRRYIHHADAVLLAAADKVAEAIIEKMGEKTDVKNSEELLEDTI